MDDDGNTPLLLAVSLGKHRVITALLKAGADTSVRDENGMPLMHVAAMNGAFKAIQILITAGLDPRSQHEGLSPLHRAVMHGHTDTVKSLLNAEVPVDEETAEGLKPIELVGNSKGGLAMKEVLQKFARSASGSTGKAKPEL